MDIADLIEQSWQNSRREGILSPYADHDEHVNSKWAEVYVGLQLGVLKTWDPRVDGNPDAGADLRVGNVRINVKATRHPTPTPHLYVKLEEVDHADVFILVQGTHPKFESIGFMSADKVKRYPVIPETKYKSRMGRGTYEVPSSELSPMHLIFDAIASRWPDDMVAAYPLGAR